MKSVIQCFIILFFLSSSFEGLAQDTTWTLQACIEYALNENIQVQKTKLTNNSNLVNEKLARAQRFPSLDASIDQNFTWQRPDTNLNVFNSSNGTSYSISSSVVLFNGLKVTNKIKQSEINYESGKYNVETTKETVSLSILNAYLQVLYAEELVKNSQDQLESTHQQLEYANARMAIGQISKSDYLQVKSQYAIENSNLANARSQLMTDRLNLMQLMQYPVSDSFTIFHPNLDSLIVIQKKPDKDSIYNIALSIKPQIKSAALNKRSAMLNEKIAQGDYFPRLLLNAGIGSGYQSILRKDYGTQINSGLKPYVGLSLNIPIYQNRLVRSQVEIARIGTENAELDELNTKTILRQNIEQASVDVITAQVKYDASLEEYRAAHESYELASGKFSNGLINSVDYIIQKTNQNVSESQLLQAKYNLIFSYKILDFYAGIPLKL